MTCVLPRRCSTWLRVPRSLDSRAPQSGLILTAIGKAPRLSARRSWSSSSRGTSLIFSRCRRSSTCSHLTICWRECMKYSDALRHGWWSLGIDEHTENGEFKKGSVISWELMPVLSICTGLAPSTAEAASLNTLSYEVAKLYNRISADCNTMHWHAPHLAVLTACSNDTDDNGKIRHQGQE